MTLARVNQAYFEALASALARVDQAYLEALTQGAVRVDQAYLEALTSKATRVHQAYVEVLDVQPFPSHSMQVNPVVIDPDFIFGAETDADAITDEGTTEDTQTPISTPDAVLNVKRIIRVAPDVTPFLSNSNTKVDVEGWTGAFPEPTYADWGRLKLVIGGKDMTYYRGHPVLVEQWSHAEPFGPVALTMRFPQVNPFQDIPSAFGDPTQGEFRNVDLYQRHPDGTKDKIWEGLAISYDQSLDGLRVECIGALYQLDLYLRRARLIEDTHPDDIVKILKDLVTPYGREKRTLRFRPLTVNPPGSVSGIEVLSHGDWNGLLTGYVSELLSQMWVEDGSTQWTIRLNTGRKPVLQLKDVTTEHYSVHVGEPGVEHSFTLDLTTAPTTIFGEGTDLDTCKWYNAKYPNIRYADLILWSGSPMSVGSTDPRFLQFEREMYDRGWTNFNRNGSYDAAEEYWVKEFQEQAGITVDGIVGAQTWGAAFTQGFDAGNLDSPYIAPLFSKRAVDYWLRAPDGSKLEKNPTFDKNVLRVERYENFGAQVTKKEGMRSAKLEVQRDWPASYYGTITLRTDPPEKSRFELREGRNILVRGFQGADMLMHIAKVDVDWDGQAVTLTVDTKSRDAMTLGQMLRRDRESTDPARRREVHRFNRSREIQDREPVWDCENGAGVLPYHGVAAGAWDVVRIPAGKLGNIVKATFELSIPARFTVGVFDRSVTANTLARIGEGVNPSQAGNPLYFFDYWQQFGDELLNAWGSAEEPGGYSPGRESGGDPLTGVIEDNASWYFESTKPPWLWVATWVESGDANGVNYLQGHMHPNNATS